ncbi:MAG: hypothetical protein HYZ13_02950 [Acidobacteria bacterium]|nr:hypothetical protein [Acidobacteriota bacterium]
MNRPSSMVLTSALIFAPAIVSAHTHKEVMGTVKAIDSSRIELMTKNGKLLSIPLVKSTMFMRGKKMVGSDQVQPGLRVVVVLAEDDKTAETVKLGPALKQK